jgi:predicted nucleotidyltransferase
MDTAAPTAIDRAIASVLAGFPAVAAAWLFGSEARGEARPDSDVDIGILLRDPRSTALDVHREIGAMAARLESVAPGRAIDLVLLEPQGPVFRHRVLSEGRLVYEADRARRLVFEAETYVRYFDWAPTHQLASRAAIEARRAWARGTR